MSITKNSAKCNHCGVEIVSANRHDFVVHYCPKAIQKDSDYEITWNFAVDGGKAYLRRSGGGFTDTSTYDDA